MKVVLQPLAGESVFLDLEIIEATYGKQKQYSAYEKKRNHNRHTKKTFFHIQNQNGRKVGMG